MSFVTVRVESILQSIAVIRRLDSFEMGPMICQEILLRLLLAFILLIPSIGYGQLTKQDSIWHPVNRLVGSWKGTGGGAPGTGQYERTYKYVLNKKYIEVRNRSTYPPTDKNPKGEVHEDIGYISYDKSRKTFVLRQFHIEGFVNQYHSELPSSVNNTIVFVSESIENIPPGFKAKETYAFTTNDRFTETFELAEPGKEFEVYTKVEFVKTH